MKPEEAHKIIVEAYQRHSDGITGALDGVIAVMQDTLDLTVRVQQLEKDVAALKRLTMPLQRFGGR